MKKNEKRGLMFGLRNRKRYNGAVDERLSSEYAIVTRDNPKFPGMLKYLAMIDEAWYAKFTEEEAAMFIASLYYSGLIRTGDSEASDLAERISSVGVRDMGKGKISMQRYAVFLAHIENATRGT